ncbi:unnamed protein product [Arabis nemorensis]|uniref:Uncharacterized protein n=1 Tax=Arabis nemorensis TaxID=586526 RepID=A0A565C5C6_9BRAS|nr:unnamed protein product [Arabis nemorensis]
MKGVVREATSNKNELQFWRILTRKGSGNTIQDQRIGPDLHQTPKDLEELVTEMKQIDKGVSSHGGGEKNRPREREIGT